MVLDAPPCVESAHHRPATPLRVMVVDDHEPIRGLLRELLTMRGCDVVGEAADGGEAVDVVAGLDCDIVVMDLQMPVMNGVKATAALSCIRPDVEVVAFTASDDPGAERDLLAAGATRHFTKSDIHALLDYLAARGSRR